MRPEHPVCTLNPGGGRGREHQAICSLPLLPPPPRPLPSARLTAAAPPPGMSDSVKDKFSVTFSIVGMFASHAAGSLSVFFCAEITPTVIRCVAGLPEVGGGSSEATGLGEAHLAGRPWTSHQPWPLESASRRASRPAPRGVESQGRAGARVPSGQLEERGTGGSGGTSRSRPCTESQVGAH